ncbi:hypothetical protein Ddc_16245 [Ditylenchus destructor]|nr:hypothetical protein Ddc_16245 [Ditylenchus destructor]
MVIFDRPQSNVEAFTCFSFYIVFISFLKPLPPFTFYVLCYLNRDQLERFSIVCRPLKNLINRYFQSKPYRVFDRLLISEGGYALEHNDVHWHPNRDDYSLQQFLVGQKCSIDESRRYLDDSLYYSFAEMRPYFGPTVRIKWTYIYVGGDSAYDPDQINEMESLAYLWRDGGIWIWKNTYDASPIVAEDFQPILNSPTILKCYNLFTENAHFSFKDYTVLYAANVIRIEYNDDEIDPDYWPQFLEQPGAKPVIVLYQISLESVDNVVDRLSKAFSSAVSPNTFKIVFTIYRWGFRGNEPLTEFRETNKTSGEVLELKKGLSTDYPNEWFDDNLARNGLLYTLERTII